MLTRRAAARRGERADERVRWTESIDEALDGCDVFVELIGGIDPAARWIRSALERGISVVTANKQLMAGDGPALLALAASRGCQLRFEGSVAGGVPVLRAIESGLAGDAISQVAGILNGTCNYILTRIEADGATFEAALAEAQALGFAEADPTQDIEGLDARAKLAILAMVALRLQVPAADIPACSIAAVTPFDFQVRPSVALDHPAGCLGDSSRVVARARRGRRPRARAADLAAGSRQWQREPRNGHRRIRRGNQFRRARRRR